MRRAVPAICLTALLLGLASCGGGGDDPARTYLPTMLEAARLRWHDGSYVLRTSGEWEAAWNGAEATRFFADGTPDRPPLPAVDFSRQMVVGLVAGTGPNGCSGLALEPPVEAPGELTIRYTIFTGAGMICTASTVPLVAFAAVAQSGKPVVFLASRP